MRNNRIIVLLLVLLHFTVVSAFSMQAYAAEENKVYDSLSDRMKEQWHQGLDDIEQQESIPIEGNITERIIRSITNVFYQNLRSIKAWAVFIGIVSITVGIFVSATAKLNKKLRRFAIKVGIITIPLLLLFSVFGITKLISIFK